MGKTPEFDKPPRQQGISLHELTEAFAQAMGNRPKVSPHPDADQNASQPLMSAGETSPEQELDTEMAADLRGPEAEVNADDEACPITPLSILEAMLFMGDPQNVPLTPSRAAELMRGVAPGDIPQLVDQLNRRYETGGCPYHIIGEGAGYRLSLTRQFGFLRNKVFGRTREARLSQAAVDVLAIVAYQQPLTADDVSRLRGTPSNAILTQLVRRQLLRIERPAEKPRKVRYYTTDRFLELFGLASLQDLPQSEELERR